MNSEIDADGSFFVRVPMNLNYVTTDEFGYIVESKDPDVGIPTLGKYRFRLSLQDDSGGKKSYRGKFLVPQIKEHQTNGNGNYSSIDDKSYSFSTNLDDYPNAAIDDIIGTNNDYGHPNDYFYSLRYNRLYTVSGFINQYYNKSSLEAIFGFFTKNRYESFLGIKEIQPESQEDCNSNNQYFPINDAVPNNKFKFLFILLLSVLETVYLLITQVIFDYAIAILMRIAKALEFRPIRKAARRFRDRIKDLQLRFVRDLSLTIYPDCVSCDGSTESGLPPSGGVQNFSIETPGDGGYVISVNEYEADLGGSFNFIEQYEDYTVITNPDGTTTTTNATPNENLYINGITLSSDSNYILEVSPGGGYLPIYFIVGLGTSYPFDTEFQSTNNPSYIEGLFGDISTELQALYNIYGQSPNTTVSGSAFSSDGTVVIDKIYRYATAEENTSGSGSVSPEAGCDKYDFIYDNPDDNYNMKLRAFEDPLTYDDHVQNPDGFSDDYPVLTVDDENPCDPPDTPYGVVASISRYSITQTSDWNSNWSMRLATKRWGEEDSTTASGYSEFRNASYRLIPAAGKNRQLILDYSRRKRLAKYLCAGYISYGFFNSWLNGSLYFFQFRRRRGGSNAKFCKDLIYRKEDETGIHYYYRSTPYYGNEFKGLYKDNLNIGESSLRNQKEILYPTTIVDLGPRNTFINEICTDSELDVNCSVSRSLGSTSYQDINDLMEYILMSKEVKEKGKLDAKDLFAGSGEGQNNRSAQKALDGDIAQLLNFNSQVGIYGYEDESEDSPYVDGNGVTIYDGVGPVGVDFVFSEDDEDTPQVEMNGALIRLCINGVGNLTETSQEVPYYKWDKKGDGFGSNESQDWVKTEISKTMYQGGWVEDGMLNSDPDTGDDDTQYYYDNDTTTELAYEAYTLPPIRDCNSENYSEDKIPLGGPFFFYFGLRTGKTSWNKFIDKFGPK